MSILQRNAISLTGEGKSPLIFIHGFGCDQTIWRRIAPEFFSSHRVILYDHVGSGRSDYADYDKQKYSTLEGYADDLIEICEYLKLEKADVVTHSAGGMIALLAARKRPERFGRLMLIAASACYQNIGDYEGGFTPDGVEELLAFLEINLPAWSAQIAPVVMANPDKPELTQELEAYFSRNDPEIAHHFGRTVFLCDHRRDIAGLPVECLIMHCPEDIVAPLSACEYLHKALPNSRVISLDARGHYPPISAPEEVTRAIAGYLTPKAA